MKKILIYAVLLAATAAAGCKKDSVKNDWRPEAKSEIATYPVQSLYQNSALLPGEYSATSQAITEKGFAVSTGEAFASEETSLYPVEGADSGPFSYMIEDLAIGQKYYYKAYIKHLGGEIVYGSVQSFFPADFAIEPADTVQGTITKLTYHSIQADITVPNLGTSSVYGLDLSCIKPAKIGIRYWPDGESEANAIEAAVPENTANLLKEGDAVNLTVAGLAQQTTYQYYFFIEVGVYSFLSSANFYMPEVHSQTDTFATDNIPVPVVASGTVTNLAANGATLNGTLSDDGGDPAVTYGFRYGADQNNLDQNIAASNRDASGNFSADIASLTFNTPYFFVAWATNGGGAATGNPGSFTTPNIDPPASTTTAATNKAVSSATLNGTVTSTGNDATATWGFYFGSDEATLFDAANKRPVASKDASNNISLDLTGLASGATFYFAAYVVNQNSEVHGSILNFATDVLSMPAISVAAMNTSGAANGIDYAYRLDHVTTTAATLTATITSGYIPGMACGFNWGTDPAPAALTAAPSSDLNSTTKVFTVTLTSLQQNVTYYVQPYASSTAGDATGPVLSFRAAVDGGVQYLYDSSISTGQIFERMTKTGANLVYHELDPVTANGVTYWVLDRNLGATQTVSESNYDKQVTTTLPPIFAAVGYSYQWGLDVPSASVNNVATNLTPYGWNSATGVAATDTWPVGKDPCPAPYVMLSRAQWGDICTELNPVTFHDLYDKLRIGTTSNRNTNGAINNNNADWYYVAWTSDAGSNATNGYVFRIAVEEKDPATPVKYSGSSIFTTNRGAAAVIRCTRIEN